MAMITIEGKDYDTEKMSEDARKQVGMIRFIDKKLSELQGEMAVCQTARNAYAKALSELLAEPQA